VAWLTGHLFNTYLELNRIEAFNRESDRRCVRRLDGVCVTLEAALLGV